MARRNQRPYDHACWRKLRIAILDRDHWRCRINLDGCTTHATHVDHIEPWESGGAWFAPDNLQAACQHCNVTKANKGRTEAWRKGPPITLVYGPPGAGKSTYVQQRTQPGQLVVDYDLIGHALGSPDRATHQQLHTAINAARNAILTKIRRAETGATHIWIISTNPNAAGMFPHHDAILLNPGLDVAYQRAQQGGRTPTALALINQWTNTTPTASRQW